MLELESIEFVGSKNYLLFVGLSNFMEGRAFNDNKKPKGTSFRKGRETEGLSFGHMKIEIPIGNNSGFQWKI